MHNRGGATSLEPNHGCCKDAASRHNRRRNSSQKWSVQVIGGGRTFGMGGKTRGVLGDRSPPAGSGIQGQSSGRGSGVGTKSPRRWRILKVVTSNFNPFLVVFHTFSPTYACFSVLAGIIPLSLWYGRHLIPFAPCLQVWGQLPPLPPAPAEHREGNSKLKAIRFHLLIYEFWFVKIVMYVMQYGGASGLFTGCWQ